MMNMSPVQMMQSAMSGKMNPTQVMQQIMGSINPMQMMNQVFGNDPRWKRAMEMAKGKTPQEVQRTALNICKENGVQFDQAVAQAQKFGINPPIKEMSKTE